MQHKEIVSGTNAVREILKSGRRRCYEIYVAEGKKESSLHEIKKLASSRGIPCRFVDRVALAEMSRVEKHQGVAAKVDPFQYTPLEAILREGKEDGFLLILDGILDPQNLGSLIRTSHLLGVQGLILPKNNAAPVGPAAMRASAGAVEYLSIAEVTNLSVFFKELKNKGYWIYGTDGVRGRSIYESDLSQGNLALVLGGEGRGMRRLVSEGCDDFVSIPMEGQIDSFNVSVAGGILLSEIVRQRKGKK